MGPGVAGLVELRTPLPTGMLPSDEPSPRVLS